jgi:phage portal protein BeeE
MWRARVNRLQLARQGAPSAEQRYSLEQYINDVGDFAFGGLGYSGVVQSWSTDKKGQSTERSDSPFEAWVSGAYKTNGVVFACQLARLLLFSEARFQFQQMRAGRPGDLFGNTELAILERPWVNGSTGELLARMIQDADLAGNAYIRRTGPLAEPRLERLRPDRVDIVLGTNSDLLNAEVVGYMFWSAGRGQGDPDILTREEVAHWSPIPDPIAAYRGMSWLSPVLREVRADGAATDHKQKFFDNAATPNMVVKFDPAIQPEKLERFKAIMEDEHKGWRNAYKNLYLGGGADATVVGADFKQMDFKSVQGAGETRIAAAAGVPPVIVGLSEGLQAATYSNYAQARRRFADMTIRPLWRGAAAALGGIVRVPAGARLWYDDRDIPALQEDEKDAAEIFKEKMLTVEAGIRAGYKPDSVAAAVSAGDLTLLVHTGLYSVQLQKPGDLKVAPPADAGAQDEGTNA